MANFFKKISQTQQPCILQQLFCHKITKLGCFILFHGTDKNNAKVRTDKGFAAAHMPLQSYRRGLEPTI